MAISMDKYVRIQSGVGGGNAVRRRDLILRIFTESALMSPDSVLEFGGPDAVADYFGRNSPEHNRAKIYFGYVSPNITRPTKLGFARDQSTPSAPVTIGFARPYNLNAIKAVSGKVTVTLGATDYTTASEVSFASAASFADVATTLQAAINGIAEAPQVLKGATVEYDAAGPRFTITGGATVGDAMKFAPDGGVADALGLSGGANDVAGVAEALPPDESVALADDISNNYGTFVFVRQLSIDEQVSIAMANAAKNVQFEFVLPVTIASYEAASAALMSIASCSLVLVADTNTEFDELIPGAIKAATDYTRRQSVVSYMYRDMPGISAKVFKTEVSNMLDRARVNYYGQTQTAGQLIAFYQRGVMMGTATAPVDQNVHANEQWLKDDAAAGFLELMRTLGRVSANTLGINKVVNTLQDTVDRALYNGTISVGKPLNTTQKLYISEQSGDETAWIQVQNIGYWVTCTVEEYDTEDGRKEWKAVYTLIYSKDDAIRKVEGTHILI